MRRRACLLLLSSLALAGGCRQSTTNQQTPTTNQSAAASPAPGQTNASATPAASPTPVVKGDVDPCSLLTSEELQAVQGEPLKETKSSGQASGGMLSLQCFYALPTFSNSVSLTLMERDPSASGGRTPKEYWRESFHEGEKAGREGRKESGEKDKERARGESREREEEEEHAVPPKPVRGLGNEAFWSASRVGGILYVLKGERFIMISIGGQGDPETKLKKAKALAQNALRRL